MYKITKDNMPKLYAALQNIGTLLLPCKNKSGHADFAPYREDAEVALDAPLTNRSAKDVFFPQVENLLTFKTSGKELALEQNIPPAGKPSLLPHCWPRDHSACRHDDRHGRACLRCAQL